MNVMKRLLKEFLRPYYHFVRNISTKLFLVLRAGIVRFFLPESYRGEFTFFEKICSQTYKDREYQSKRIRMLTHFVDKTFTLSKRVDKATTARQVEIMLQNFPEEKESDHIIRQWAEEVLRYNREPQKSQLEENSTLPPSAPDVISMAIKTRRTVRSYQSRKIEDAILNKILEAGLWAPSGCNRQPIEYLIVNDANDILLCQKYAGEFYNFPQEAAVNIVVLIDPRCYALPHQRHMAYLDSGAAIQNILLSAHSLGLGSCWMFWAKHDQAFNKKFNLPPWLLPVGLVCIGYADQRPPIVPKRKSVYDCIYDMRTKDKS
jgi:nitroreductase